MTPKQAKRKRKKRYAPTRAQRKQRQRAQRADIGVPHIYRKVAASGGPVRWSELGARVREWWRAKRGAGA